MIYLYILLAGSILYSLWASNELIKADSRLIEANRKILELESQNGFN